MPPALHPRSGFTTSLFGSTLALSFLVVGLPHLLPCPVPRTPQAADGQMEIVDADGRRYRRRLAPKTVVEDAYVSAKTRLDTSGGSGGMNGSGLGEGRDEETEELRRKARECPVPKPAGMVGRMLGFRREEQRVVPGVHIVGGDDVRIASGKDENKGG